MVEKQIEARKNKLSDGAYVREYTCDRLSIIIFEWIHISAYTRRDKQEPSSPQESELSLKLSTYWNEHYSASWIR